MSLSQIVLDEPGPGGRPAKWIQGTRHWHRSDANSGCADGVGGKDRGRWLTGAAGTRLGPRSSRPGARVWPPANASRRPHAGLDAVRTTAGREPRGGQPPRPGSVTAQWGGGRALSLTSHCFYPSASWAVSGPGLRRGGGEGGTGPDVGRCPEDVQENAGPCAHRSPCLHLAEAAGTLLLRKGIRP